MGTQTVLGSLEQKDYSSSPSPTGGWGTKLPARFVSQSASVNIKQRGNLSLERPNSTLEAAESHTMFRKEGPRCLSWEGLGDLEMLFLSISFWVLYLGLTDPPADHSQELMALSQTVTGWASMLQAVSGNTLVGTTWGEGSVPAPMGRGQGCSQASFMHRTDPTTKNNPVQMSTVQRLKKPDLGKVFILDQCILSTYCLPGTMLGIMSLHSFNPEKRCQNSMGCSPQTCTACSVF